jgi:protein transport protein HofB
VEYNAKRLSGQQLLRSAWMLTPIKKENAMDQATQLAELALRYRLITHEQFTPHQSTPRSSLEAVFTVLTQSLAVDAKRLAHCIARETNYQSVDITLPISQWPYQALPLSLILKYRVIPYRRTNNHLTLACAYPLPPTAQQQLQFQSGCHIELAIIDFISLTEHLAELTRLLRQQQLTSYWQSPADHQPADITDFFNLLIRYAVDVRASDIHCEPHPTGLLIRLRIDGLLHELTRVTPNHAKQFITHIKVLAKMDIAEQRLPQDGHYQLTQDGSHYDLRVSVCPTIAGEKAVLRVLTGFARPLTIGELGLTERQHRQFQHAISQPHGLILVTGPTGSGKTMTLYTALQYLQHASKNIVTVEDPVEIQLPGAVNQIQINHKIDLTFARCLRSLLRQDPDIMMIGEIRDAETATIAISAAQTGHLVLATLHTNSASASIRRLTHMGVHSHHLIDTLLLIINQRLLRKLCQQCQRNESIQCPVCHDGYHGRTGVFELIQPRGNWDPSRLQPDYDLLQAARDKIDQHITDQAEVTRVIQWGNPA